jgi:tetratricopeptide (TPR) repeat protein
MGTVYEAWQRSLQRVVALKVLARHVSATPKAVLRFQREAQAAAKLHHTHIVPIFAQAETDGVYYYAMELIDGTSLHNMIVELRDSESPDSSTADLSETVPLPPRGSTTAPALPSTPTSSVVASRPASQPRSWEQFHQIAEHMADVADALDYAHQRGVVHRDIKPHNLLIGRDGRMRISDFGLARLAEQPGVTVTGEVIGSPLYMSPEQISGNADDVDPRADIYSLGATMYEWLTLRPPYPGDTRERVISRILSSEATAPRTLNPAMPIDLETICLKAIERNRERRYRNAAELRDDLRRYLANRPIVARRTGPVGRTLKLIARHQFASLATAAAVIAVALTWALWSSQRAAHVQTQAAVEAKQSQELVVDLLSRLPPEIQVVLRGAEVARPMVQGIGLEQAGSLLGGLAGTNDPRAPAVGSSASLARRLGEEFYRSVAPPRWPAASVDGESAAHLKEAVNRWQTNDLEGARALLDSYLEVHPGDFEARQLHTVLSGQLGHYDKVVEGAEYLLALRGQTPHGYFWRALALLLLERTDGVADDLAKAETLEGPTTWVKMLHGLALVQLGRPVDAVVFFDEVLGGSQGLVIARLGRALAHFAAGRHREAIVDATEVIRLEPSNADAFTIRGDCYEALTDYAAAAADFQEAMSIAGRTQALGIKYLRVLMQRHRAEGKDAQPPAQPETAAHPAAADPDESGAPLFKWISRKIWPRSGG